MYKNTLTIKTWIGTLALAVIFCFGFAGQAYSLEAVHIADGRVTLVSASRGVAAQVVLVIADRYDIPVANVSVSGKWSGVVKGNASAVTGIDGRVTFVSRSTGKSGIFVFTITDVSGEGLSYNPSITQIDISTDAPVNQKPIADATSSLISGVAPLTVNFDAYGSYDPDGGIESYEWSFSDGTSGYDPEVSKCFELPGTYTVELIVTDDQWATDTDILEITVTSDGPIILKDMYVADIVMSPLTVKGGKVAVAIVSIESENFTPVKNATVTGEWSGLRRGTASGVTGEGGTVTFTSGKSKKSGDFIFTVTDVIASGNTYDADQNIETGDSIANP